MERHPKFGATAVIVLAVLGVIAALYLLKAILVPIALALLLACMLAPITTFLRRFVPLGPTGAAVFLFLLTVVIGLYVASLTAESLVQAAKTLPADVERLSGQASHRITDMIRDKPYLRGILPEPGTIDQFGDANRALLIDKLSYGLADLTFWVGQGLIIMFLVLFLLAESEMLTPKVIRFFAPTHGDAQAAGRTLARLTRQIRAYLVARTLINIGLGGVIALALRMLGVKFAFGLGLFAALANFIPYLGQIIAGALATLVAFGQTGSPGDMLIVAAVYLAVVGIEGYLLTPYIMGRSLDLNGTTVLIACLFWAFLWGLVGLVLVMPITVCMKLVFQSVPELNRWAELMSRDWQTPGGPGAPPGPTASREVERAGERS
ncbi:MAG: AI-2E family transporter [Isosphaeraceae bacterium]|nr:AI-2E family transporter [Isosphaeraceae bacterium]